MKHLKSGRKFGRVKNQREAMLKTMLGSLIMKEKIETTEAKAKELKIVIDRIINRAKQSKTEAKKVSVIRALNNKLPAMAVKKLTGAFLDKFTERGSGYTRVIKIGARQSDSAKIAVIEFV
ncbi:MAG: 50S ribosomal protein L17 [Parcubacteria group bacterium]|jgi:large subunit ribosomal protein L17